MPDHSLRALRDDHDHDDFVQVPDRGGGAEVALERTAGRNRHCCQRKRGIGLGRVPCGESDKDLTRRRSVNQLTRTDILISNSMRKTQILAIGLALAASPLAAQQPAAVSGRVVERGGLTAIVGVTVELSGTSTVMTGPDGTFLFRRVAPGPHTLSASALGYAPTSSDIIVSGDTTLVIELDPAPIRLDSLVARARNVTVKGDVKDKARNMGLLNVEVYVANRFVDRTDGIGRFRINDVPANVPIPIRIEEFGYLPLTATIAPDNDTTLHFALVPDPIVSKMIDEQIVLIAERAADTRYPFMPPIDRETLLRSRSQSVREIIRRTYRRSVSCYTIDERNYSGAIMADILNTMRPDDIEHIDALWSPDRTTLMLRIYTRDFIRRMIGDAELLVPLQEVLDGANTDICR